jgi:hypothetical protein
MTFTRLTLNPGVRFEFFNTCIPKEVSPAGPSIVVAPLSLCGSVV